jgi:uncharacterized protein YdcH (DUF465 family)
MELLNHDLAHEFPQYLEKMRALKVTDPHFARLFAEYDEDDHAVKKYELGVAVISEQALVVLKKKRLKTKDEIFQRLKTA